MKSTAFVLVILACGFSGSVEACKGPVPPASVIADDIKVDVNAACTTVTAVFQDVAVALVCATVEEVASLGDLIVHQTSLVATVDGGIKLTCVSAHEKALCATPAQMAAAIKVMNARRIHGVDGGHL